MGLFDGLFDKKQMVANTIDDCIEKCAEELELKPNQLFIMIKAVKEEFVDYDEENPNTKFWLYKVGGIKVRELSLEEILGDIDKPK